MNTKNCTTFGVGPCEDVNAISDESDRPCADAPALQEHASEAPSDTAQALPAGAPACAAKQTQAAKGCGVKFH